MDAHTFNPNKYVDFYAYDFNRKSWLKDYPAWGRSFYFNTALTMKSISPGDACYFGVFKYKASAKFYFQMPVGVVPAVTKPPKDIEISVYDGIP
ncbi:hypothetical protein [Thermococcus sp.]|uniref:hypothetical protein n=1 Tax=Thermococcus sp. TaxID=35749 RepID=UPI00262DBB4E|nr:hypothetical protein [Thermococcus sp.]